MKDFLLVMPPMGGWYLIVNKRAYTPFVLNVCRYFKSKVIRTFKNLVTPSACLWCGKFLRRQGTSNLYYSFSLSYEDALIPLGGIWDTWLEALPITVSVIVLRFLCCSYTLSHLIQPNRSGLF